MRKANHADVLEMLRLGIAMHRESRFARFMLNATKIMSTFHAMIDSENFIVLVDGDPIHAMFVGCIQEFWWGDELESVDMLLYVSPEKRVKSSAAVKLVQGYIAIARAKGVADIRISTGTGVQTERTVKFYEHMGFAPMQFGFALPEPRPN